MPTTNKPLPSTEALAQEFAAHLLVCIGDTNFKEVIRRNPTYGEACASHDFCDANVVMLEALQALAPHIDVDDVLSDNEIGTLWEEAWSHAKSTGFSDFLASCSPQ